LEEYAVSKLRSFRIPEEDLKRLDEIAESRHANNKTQALLEAIDRYYKDLHPPSLQGYVQLDRPNNRNGNSDCQRCNQSKDTGLWIGVYSDGTIKGLLCDDCVEETGE
jgi:hypothetical protein